MPKSQTEGGLMGLVCVSVSVCVRACACVCQIDGPVGVSSVNYEAQTEEKGKQSCS